MSDIIDTVAAAGSLTVLAAALRASRLHDAWRVHGPFTVFAPTDDAFAEIAEDELARLLDGHVRLDELVSCHVAAGRHGAGQLAGLGFVRTLQGLSLAVDAVETALLVHAALVVQSDIDADNGVIHIIDRVLVPERVRRATTGPGIIPTSTSDQAIAPAGALILVEAVCRSVLLRPSSS